MNVIKKIVKLFLVKIRCILLAFPKRIQCNICLWEGRRFISNQWHKNINCPKCNSGIRHRLFIAALQNIKEVSIEKIIHNKDILHFAAEKIISKFISDKCNNYKTADILRKGFDLRLDMSNMEVQDASYDIVMAFDVLEHVPDYKKALEEVYRVLKPGGFGIFTVPQKDNLLETYEDPNIITSKEREEHFGQWDHLRIFGDDISKIIENKGFHVNIVDESKFPNNIQENNVLFPPVLSNLPGVTNYRKVFFCKKI